ncbi:MAG: phosphoglucosamine mutase [Bacteroidota bacterium]
MQNKGTLIVSISGIRGIFGDGLDPAGIVQYATAFGTWCARRAASRNVKPLVIVGRDARVTGKICANLVIASLQSTGCDVVDLDLATTPTVASAVLDLEALGGVILSASHNPVQWNALKMLGDFGEFLRASEAEEVIQLAQRGEAETVSYEGIGSLTTRDYLQEHIQSILDLPYIKPEKIAGRDFKVTVDAINSVGGIAIPALLEQLGVRKENITVLNGEPNGLFAHNPEPLPQNLTGIVEAVAREGADLGIVVDPDADRLALVADGGVYVSEELTQVMAADFLFRHNPGPFVTNLSSSRAIEDVAAGFNVPVYRAPVGEINIVDKMKEVDAVLGGEGSGGVILAELHHGRDALIGAAMILQHLTDEDISMSELLARMPVYAMSKGKIPLGELDADHVLAVLAERFKDEKHSTIDGLKIDFPDGWVHLRKSNTEPILRIYTEAPTAAEADQLANRFREALESVGAEA